MEDFEIPTIDYEEQIEKIKVAVKLNNNNVIIDLLYFRSEDYTEYPEFQIIEVEDINAIILFKTKLVNGELIQCEDYCQEYYTKKQNEELRLQLQQAIHEIENWFNEYDMQVKQYERDVRLEITGTYHIGEEEYTIGELDQEAISKAVQINGLREQLQELDNIVIVADSSEE